MLAAAAVLICMAGQPCTQYGGQIASAWCGKSATLMRPPSMGGNIRMSVTCQGRHAGR